MPEKWRLIQDPLLDGHENMAVDEAVLTASDAAGHFTPTLRLYGWRTPTISTGYRQEPAAFSGHGMPVVRRITGGRAVLHCSEITYAVTAPAAHPLFSGGISQAYFEISRCIMSALRDAGVEAQMMRTRTGGHAGRLDACFAAPSRHEVLVKGKKIVGSAQRRFKNAFLQHGSIVFSIDRGLTGRVFGEGLCDAMTCVSAHTGAGIDAVRELLVRNFSTGLGVSFEASPLSEAEEYVKKGLLESRHSNSGCGNAGFERLRGAY